MGSKPRPPTTPPPNPPKPPPLEEEVVSLLRNASLVGCHLGGVRVLDVTRWMLSAHATSMTAAAAAAAAAA